MPYVLEYELTTVRRFVTDKIQVKVHGDGWSRWLHLKRRAGGWRAPHGARGRVDLPPPGGDLSGVSTALDCDLAWSPLTNSMPVLRHGLLTRGGPIDFVMAWVSVPDLSVHMSAQRYTFVRREGDHSIVRYESASRDFVADLVFDSDGLVISYPGIGRTPPPSG